jgi:hypothetical protein
MYDISFSYATGNSRMTDNANSESTTQFTQIQRIAIYTSTTYIKKNYNFLLSEFKSGMLRDFLNKQKTFTGRDGRMDRHPNIIQDSIPAQHLYLTLHTNVKYMGKHLQGQQII